MSANLRKEALEALVAFSNSTKNMKQSLERFEWDCDETLAVLTLAHIEDVLSRFQSGQLSAMEIEEWANLIECRDGVAFEQPFGDEIERIVFALANPALEGELTIGMAAKLVFRTKELRRS